MTDPVVIRGFPDSIATIPQDRDGWLRWRKKVLAYRLLLHRMADEDPQKRAAIIQMAADDPLFFMAIFGVLHEPRGAVDMDITDDGEVVEMVRPRGWFPWVPYPFQGRMIRWINEVLARENDLTGKGDGVVEKSRDMGATWTFCLQAGWQWLFDDDVFIGLLSHKEILVDSANPSSMFYKIRALLGLNSKVPEVCYSPGTPYDGIPVRLPAYLYPQGFESKQHDMKLNLRHPTKTNQIFGESTTSKSGIGSRTSWSLIDEAAKIPELMDIWSGLSAVTDHRFANSSADRREGDGMYLLAQQAKDSINDPTIEGPSLLSLPWHAHPLRDDEWYQRMKSRHGADAAGFAREYEIDWDAGFGDWVYPVAKQIVPEPVAWDPALGQVYCSIDPGIRDPTAVEWFQHKPGTDGEYNLFEALVLHTPSAEYLAPILMGWPPMHPMREDYPSQAIQEVMDLMWRIRESRMPITYVGDPYGDNVGGASSDTYYTALWRRAQELNQEYPDLPPVEIAVMTRYDEAARYHAGRKEALTRFIPRVTFNNSVRVRHIVDALQSYRYKSQEDGRSVMNEPNRPLHDWSSHPTTCAEFMAVVATINTYLNIPAPKPVKFGRKR